MKRYLLCLVSAVFLLTTIGTALGDDHAYLWDPVTGIRDLGTLGDFSQAYAVNDSGTVVGIYAPTDGRTYYHGFIWTEATGMVDIGVPGGGDSNTAEVMCTGINSAGNVSGYARQVDGKQVAFFWSPTEGFTTLGTISSEADNGNTAYAINDLDQMTGNLLVSAGHHQLLYHAYLWSPGMGQPRDLGSLTGPTGGSSGTAINNLTEIVGGSGFDGLGEPMKWERRFGMKLIGLVPGTLYAEAEGINDAGQIIGLDQTGTHDRGFYTAPGVGLRFLKGLGGTSAVAKAINQNGVMVGYADDANFDTYGVRWTSFTSVPEIIRGADNALGINNLGQVVGTARFPK